MTSEDFIKRRKRVMSDLQETSSYLDQGAEEAARVHNLMINTRSALDSLDQEFKERTGLTTTDTAFLFLAIGLQIARQYLLKNDQFRLTANQGDVLMENILSLTPPTCQEVLTQSVPYDAIKTGVHVSDTGIAGTTHRYRTLGHDPILGWVFGTANIMTNSLTKTNLETYQVKNMTIVRHYPLGVTGMLDRAVHFGLDDPVLFAASVGRQAVHFGSDYFTKQGLPIPIIPSIDNNLAKSMLTRWNIDAYSVSRGAAIATFINTMIALAHGLFFDGVTEMDRKTYEVRTRKILSYSNLVTTSSNLVVVGVTQDFSKLDLGGAAVTIYRLIQNINFIKKVKEEFVFGSFKDMIRGNDDWMYR